MSIGSIAQNQSMETGSNHVTQSLTASKSTFTSKNTYADFVGDFETKRDTSNYDVVLPLPIGRNKKVIGVMFFSTWDYMCAEGHTEYWVFHFPLNTPVVVRL